MRKTAKRLLSTALVLVMVLSMLPAVTLPAQAAGGDTTDAFGISMADWTAAEKAEAEANLPFGTGYGTWTTLSEMNELFFSMAHNSDTMEHILSRLNHSDRSVVLLEKGIG